MSKEHSPRGFTFESHGLYISTREQRRGRSYSGITTPSGTRVGFMHFTPSGIAYHEVRARSHSLYQGLQAFEALDSFSQELEAKGLSYLIPEYLIGVTNKEMAHFAERVGLTTSDVGFTFETQSVGVPIFLSKPALKGVRVIGKTSDVISAYRALRQRLEAKGKIQGLRERDSAFDPKLVNARRILRLGTPFAIATGVSSLISFKKGNILLSGMYGVLTGLFGVGIAEAIYDIKHPRRGISMQTENYHIRWK